MTATRQGFILRTNPSSSRLTALMGFLSFLSLLFHELTNPLFQGCHGLVVPSGSQPRDVGLREALILPAQRLRERYVLDLAPAQETDHDAGDVIEAAALSCAHIHDRLSGRSRCEMEIDRHRIAHEDEITPLLAS